MPGMRDTVGLNALEASSEVLLNDDFKEGFD
jgi:hypothetical protein